MSKRANEQFAHIKEQFTHLLIYHEQPEQIAHSQSFDMSDLRNSLAVALLTWATWAIRSQSLICPDWSEWIAHSWAIWLWAKELISNKQVRKFPTLRIGEDFEEKSFLSLAKHFWIWILRGFLIRIPISLKSGIRILVKTFWICHTVLKGQSGEILLGLNTSNLKENSWGIKSSFT